MSRNVKLTLALAVAAAAAVTGVLATQGGASHDEATLSNRGRPLAIRGLRTRWTRITTGNVLAVRHGRVLYRLEQANGDPCFGVGPAEKLGSPGSVICPRGGFPTAGSPILDFSVYEGTRHDVRELSLYRAEGFAADGVAAVEFFRPDGTVVLTVPVSGNVYSTTAVPKGPVAGAYAVDKNGKRLGRSP
jgi:hypothetical protein